MMVGDWKVLQTSLEFSAGLQSLPAHTSVACSPELDNETWLSIVIYRPRQHRILPRPLSNCRIVPRSIVKVH